MNRLVYPRLSMAMATALLPRLREALESEGLSAVRALSASGHPKASPIPTGGRLASVEHIEEVQQKVRGVARPWTDVGQVAANDVSRFDAGVGEALHEHLQIVPADAAHAETWNFLTLVVLPDVAVLRFPRMHPRRMLGTERNALRRTWIRHEVLGELMRHAERPLGEDELVGMFERTALARNRELLRQLAKRVLSYDGNESRSHWARDLYKRVTFATGPRLLDALSVEELAALIDASETLPESSELAPVKRSQAPANDEPSRTAHGSVGSASALRTSARESKKPTISPLEKSFNGAMVQIYHRARRELGYSANYFVGMLAREGGLATAHRLVRADAPSEGFTYLWERGRLDLSVEALVLDPEYRELFEEGLLEQAFERLLEHGFDVELLN